MDFLYLDAAASGMGLVRRLVTRIAHDAGCQLIQWQTPTFNTRAISLYSRLGATQKDKVRFFLERDATERLAAEDMPPG